VIITGLDTICHVGTVLSFMLENLSKLVNLKFIQVVCTGGYLPLSRMRNDSVSNLVECFSVVA
jgi:L-asparaginase/Glu-tRNA(Gln) amidotransferase subunit D